MATELSKLKDALEQPEGEPNPYEEAQGPNRTGPAVAPPEQTYYRQAPRFNYQGITRTLPDWYLKQSEAERMKNPLGLDWFKGTPEPKGYWESPSVLFRYNNVIQSGGDLPEWLNADAISSAYNFLDWYNSEQGREDWTEWQLPEEDNHPLRQMLRSLNRPPTEYLQDDEMYWAGDAGQPWRDYMEQQGYRVDPERVPEQAGTTGTGSGVDGAVTRDDLYQAMGETPEQSFWDLPAWQRAYMSLFSAQGNIEDQPWYSKLGSSLVSGLFSAGGGAGAGALAGGIVGGPAGAGIGATIGFFTALLGTTYQSYTGTEIPGLSSLLEFLDMGERFGRVGIGFGEQVAADDFEGVLEDLPAAMVASDAVYSTWNVDLLNAGAYTDAYIKTMTKALEDGYDWPQASEMAVEAGKAAMAQDGEVWQISMGYSEPVPMIDAEGNLIEEEEMYGGEALENIREGISGDITWGDVAPYLLLNLKPEEAAPIFSDVSEMYGDTGAVNDLVFSTLIDPTNLFQLGGNYIGQGAANLAGNSRLASAFQQSRGSIFADLAPFGLDTILQSSGLKSTDGVIQTFRTYGDWVRNGYYPDGTRPLDADGNQYTPAAHELNTLERWLGGVDKDGMVKELKPTEGRVGLFKYMRDLTPDTKASMGLFNLADTINVVAEGIDDSNLGMVNRARKLVDTLTQMGTANPFEVGSASEAMVNSPAFATVSAVYNKAVQDGILKEMQTQLETDQLDIQLLERAAKVLDTNTSKLVEDMANDPQGTYRAFQGRLEVLANEGNKMAQALMAQVESGDLNLTSFWDRLAKFTGKDSKGNEYDVHAWTFEDWRARTLNKLFDASADKMIAHYGLKPGTRPAEAVLQLADTLKAAQSMLLLDLNPAYLVNNVINNFVTMNVEGVYGVFTMKQADAWLDRFGTRSMRMGADKGRAAGLDTTGPSPIMRIQQAMQGDSIGSRIKKGIQRTRSAVGVMSKLSGMMEEAQSKRAYVTGMKKAWNGLWREGVGYSKMPAALEAALDNIDPNLTKQVYGVVRGAMNVDEINAALYEGVRKVSIERAVDEAALKVNKKNPEILRELISQLGLDEKLRTMLDEAETATDIERAFLKLNNEVKQEIFAEATRKLAMKAGEVEQIFAQEGFRGVMRLVGETEVIAELFHLESLEKYGKLYADEFTTEGHWKAQELADRAQYQMIRDTRTAVLEGVVRFLGDDHPLGKQIMDATQSVDQGWTDMYNGYDVVAGTANRRATAAELKDPNVKTHHVDGWYDWRRRYFELKGTDNALQWSYVEGKHQELLNPAWENEFTQRQMMDDAFVALWENYNQTGAEAQTWRDAVTRVRREMFDAQVEHQKEMALTEDFDTRKEMARTFYDTVYRPLEGKLIQAAQQGQYEHELSSQKAAAMGKTTGAANTASKLSDAERVEQVLNREGLKRRVREIERVREAQYMGQLDRKTVVRAMESIYHLNAQESEAVQLVMDLRAEQWGRESNQPAEAWYSETFADLVNEYGEGIYEGRRSYDNRLNEAGQGATLEQDIKGAVEFLVDGRAILRGMQAGDVSTAVHELGHVFRRQLSEAQLKVAADWQGMDAAVIRQGASIFDEMSRAEMDRLGRLNQEGTLTADQAAVYEALQAYIDFEEQFARGFERWLSEQDQAESGAVKLPARIARIFTQFAEWIKGIYQKIVGNPIEVDLNAGMNKLYGQLLGIGEADAGHYSDVQMARNGMERVSTFNREGRTEAEGMWIAGADQVVDLMVEGFENGRVYLPEIIDANGEKLPASLYAEALKMEASADGNYYTYDWEEVPYFAKFEMGQRYMSTQGWGRIPYQMLYEWLSEGREAMVQRVKDWQNRQSEIDESAYAEVEFSTDEGKGTTTEVHEPIGDFDVVQVEPFKAGGYLIDHVWRAMGKDFVWVPKFRVDGTKFENTEVAYYPQWGEGSEYAYIVGVSPNDVELLAVEAADGSIEYIPKYTEEMQLFQGEDAQGNTQDTTTEKMEGKGVVKGSEAFPLDEAQTETMHRYLKPMLDEMENSAMEQFTEKKLTLGELDASTQDGLRAWLEDVREQMPGTKLAAMRKGEGMRDAALLNYSKRYGFDQFLEIIFPYQFWYTRSVMEWARRMIDKPQWFRMYARLRRFQKRQEERVPSRLKGKMKFMAPYLPDWAGNMGYWDPMKQLFPFESLFGGPFQQAQMERSRQTQTTFEVLRTQLEQGQITEAEYDTAVDTQDGYVWTKAWTMAGEEVGAMGVGNPFSLASIMMGKAMYIDIPQKLLAGTPEKISTMPFTRLGQALEYSGGDSIFGKIGSALASPERAVREKFDLNEFGEWGDYYIDRQLSNMASENPLMTDQIQQVMITREGPLYDEAYQRVLEEMAYRVPGVQQAEAVKAALRGESSMLDVMGSFVHGWLPTTFVGTGELALRGLADEYSAAWDAYGAGNKDAVNDFFEAHPEYEARLALYDEPEERLRQYLVSDIWELWAALEGPNKNMIADQLPGFRDGILEKETRDYTAFTPQQLANIAATLRYYVGESAESPSPESVLNMAGGSTQMMTGLYSDQVNDAVAQYWNDKNATWPGISQLEQAYYASGENAPEDMQRYLQTYWDWKEDYMTAHPEVDYYSEQEKMNRLYEEYPKAMADDIVVYLYDEDMRWGNSDVKDLQSEYFDLKEESKAKAKAFLGQHPELIAYWDWKRNWRESSPGVNLYLDRYNLGDAPTWWGEFADDTETVERISTAQLESMDSMVLSAVSLYYSGTSELGTGTRALLRYYWEQQGMPGGTFEAYVEEVLRASMGQ